MSDPPIPKDDENYYHPSQESEIIALVNYARENQLQVRVRGSGHSQPKAIYTDQCVKDHINVCAPAPDGKNINIKLDRYTKILSVSGSLVTVQAGIHLGRDVNDPLSTEENCFLYQLHHTYGLAVDDLGGVTSQTVAGFLSMGCSGGTTTYDFLDNVQALRFVDGNGKIFEVSRDDKDLDNFNASLVSLGLFGVISTITFNCVEKFNIKGTQHGTYTHQAQVDIFSDNPTEPQKVGLTPFLKATEYTRILWWPQTSKFVDHGKDLVQIWKAERIASEPGFERKPFKEFDNAEIMVLYSYLMTLLGNIDDMAKVREIAKTYEDRFKSLAASELEKEFHMEKKWANDLAELFHYVNTFILDVVTGMTEIVPEEIRKLLLPHFTTLAIKLLNMLGKNVEFQDHGYLGLPMDNTADDIIVPTMFTEIWVPLSRAVEATTTLQQYFSQDHKDFSDFYRTGNNGWELYASKPSSAWMGMSYSNGEDEWKEGVFRVDPYWFVHNSANPRELYRPIWLLFKEKGIPFRLHWAKVFPALDDKDITAKDLVADQYPQLQKFLELRKKRDPNDIFLSSYWSHWLGISGIHD